MNISLILITFQACAPKTSGSADADSNKVKIDTLKKIQIDTIVERMHATIRATGLPTKIPYPEYNPEDSIDYWMLNDHSGRISIPMKPPGKIEWPVFYVHENKLIKVRFRYFSDHPESRKASETFIYLDNGKIIFCEERGRTLAEGEFPGLIRQLPFAPSTRTQAEIQLDYLSTWKKILAVLKEHEPLAKNIIE